jgi:hypothetical protein
MSMNEVFYKTFAPTDQPLIVLSFSRQKKMLFLVPVGESVVVHVGNLVVDKDGHARVLFEQLLLDKGAIFNGDIETGPSDPCELHHALETGQSRDESSGRHLVLIGS